ncbi:MAG: thioredoxin family protein [Phycisphaerae bacterium]|jgi:small redox-active disulfide protein 2
MKVEVLGPGCQRCDALANAVQTAINGLSLDCEFSKVTDMKKIMTYGVMVTPALVVDGEVKLSGKVPSIQEIQDLLRPPDRR